MPGTGANLTKRMQLGGTRRAKKPVPYLGAEAQNAGQTGLDVAKSHRAQQSGEVSAERSNRDGMILTGVHSHDEEDREASQWGRDGLRDAPGGACCYGRNAGIRCHRRLVLAGLEEFRFSKSALACKQSEGQITTAN